MSNTPPPPRSRPGRPSKRQQAENDRRVLDAALEIFNVRCYGDTSVDMIADRAGVAKATIYRRFVSKERLLVEAIEAAVQILKIDLRALRAAGATLAVLREMMLRLWREGLDERGLDLRRLVIATGPYDDVLRGNLSRWDGEIGAPIEEVLEVLMRHGDLVTIPVYVARTILQDLVSTGPSTRALNFVSTIDGNPIDSEDDFELRWGVIMSGLGAVIPRG